RVKSKTQGQRSEVLFAFAGGRGTANCREQATKRGIEVGDITPVAEPRPWNMRHRWRADHPQPPGLVYVGRSPEWGGPSPLANPCRLEPRKPRDAQVNLLDAYR